MPNDYIIVGQRIYDILSREEQSILMWLGYNRKTEITLAMWNQTIYKLYMDLS